MPQSVDIIVIGAGQAGLAASRCLSDLGVDHLVLDAHRPGQSWRDRRPSLRLLTPNWMTRLPGDTGRRPDPDGFMGMHEVAGLLERYASRIAAPILPRARVEEVTAALGRVLVHSTRGSFLARGIVVATGACRMPAVPALARGLSPGVAQLAAADYGCPGDLPPGGVLVVGASASGAQIADDLARAGRRVVLAVGRHTRVPRRWRGRDVMAWMDQAGILDERPVAGTADATSAFTSLQLIGSAEHRDLDLGTLQARGVEVAGRLTAVDAAIARFGSDLPELAARADARMHRLLDRLDAYIALRGIEAPPGEMPAAVSPAPGPDQLDLAAEGIGTVVWATGYRRAFDWLKVPVLDRAGEIVQRAGITPVAGVYVLGMPLLTRRKSTFIDGVGEDARAVAHHIRWSLLDRRRAA